MREVHTGMKVQEINGTEVLWVADSGGSVVLKYVNILNKIKSESWRLF